MDRFEQILIGARFHFPGAGNRTPWWRENTQPIADVLRVVESVGLWLDFRFWGRAGSRRPARVESLDALLATLPTWEDHTYRIGADAHGGAEGSYLEMILRRDWLVPTLVVGGDDFEARRAALLDSAEGLLVQWHTALRGRAWLQPVAGVTTYPTYSPPSRPPRAAAIWPGGALLDVVNPRFAQEPGSEWPANISEELEQALGAALPPSARRVKREGLIVFRWVDDLRDEDTVLRALEARQQWIAEALDAPVMAGWNEAGDQEVVLVQREARPSVPIYDARLRVGYLPIVATDDGEVDEEALAAAATWVRDGRLPDGTPLAGLRLIAPVRDAAIALRARSRPLGMPKALYVTSDGRLWDPFPEGFDDG